MATRTIVCPECEVPLSPGRFACSACGALVASVAAVARSFDEPDFPYPIGTQVGTQAEVAPVPRSVDVLLDDDDGWDDVRHELDAPPANGRLADEVAGDLPLAFAVTSHSEAATIGDADAPDAIDDGVADEPDAHTPTETAEAAWPDHSTWPLPTVDPRTPPSVLGLVGGPEDEPDPASVDDAASVSAGAYLPPSAVLRPGDALPRSGAAAVAGSVQGSAAVGAGGPVTPGSTRGPLSGLPDSLNALAVPGDVGSRTIAIGGGIAALGFVLPWAGVVIGSRSLDGGLLSTWGLAGPAALLAFLLVLGLTALAALRQYLPGWIGLSTPAMALAALLAGILWPYLFGSFGAAIGVYVVATGALVLAAGGLIDRVAARHEDTPAGV